MCATLEWIRSGGNSFSYYSRGGGQRGPRKNCMVGYIDCLGSCTTTTTTTTVPCGPTEGLSGNGQDYRGCQDTTQSGKTCQYWSSQSPHKHGHTPQSKPNMGLDGNFCRNPDGSKQIWCYTTDAKTKREDCKPVPTTTTTTTTPGPAFWVRGAEGENCLMVCGDAGCWENEWWPADENYFRDTVLKDSGTSCTSVEEGDWTVNPAQYEDYGNSCFWKTDAPQCAGSAAGVARFCPCRSRPTTTTTTTVVTTTTEEPTTTTTAAAETTTKRQKDPRRGGPPRGLPTAPPGEGDAPPPGEGDAPPASRRRSVRRRRRRTSEGDARPGRRRSGKKTSRRRQGCKDSALAKENSRLVARVAELEAALKKAR